MGGGPLGAVSYGFLAKAVGPHLAILVPGLLCVAGALVWYSALTTMDTPILMFLLPSALMGIGNAPASRDNSHTHHDEAPRFRAIDHAADSDDEIESIAEEDVAEEISQPRRPRARRYKIQEVIKMRQIMLVQVVKEERGNKGAALTTYLSLAGRYTVLMPNSSHGGGISRKISSTSDRKRLKDMVSDLKLPKSMGLIVRTAGMSRTKPEIKRDFDYLARVWDEIRENTLASVAPALIHSDSDLIKRAIRDIYNKEIEEVVVEGEDGYKSAKAFMKLLMPSHARRVKAYSDPVPLFQRYGAEDQLRAMYDPMVQLKSGGYLIINPTEALVSIDINSGRSTKEHGIEATALHTNLEAAKEIARQLRLRDMAGLVVIDFIDMEYSSNVRKVEKAMKDALKNDRARIQIGRISSFGLMEMSRQRLRTGVLEATTRPCPHCDGTGLVRTASSAGLSALRLIEDEAARGKGTIIRLAASTEAAIYLLNEKRADLVEIEQRYGVSVEVVPEGEDEGADRGQERPWARIDDVVVVILLVRFGHFSNPRMSISLRVPANRSPLTVSAVPCLPRPTKRPPAPDQRADRKCRTG